MKSRMHNFIKEQSIIQRAVSGFRLQIIKTNSENYEN